MVAGSGGEVKRLPASPALAGSSRAPPRPSSGPLIDYLDIDGPLLITNDPYRGVEYDKGRLRLPGLPGLGVMPEARKWPPGLQATPPMGAR
jgi:hypothetical protein